MYDLIYDGDAEKSVRKRFPTAIIKDESDAIHESRIGIELPDERNEEYLRWVVMEGWGSVSMLVRLMIYDTKGQEKVKTWIDEGKAAAIRRGGEEGKR